MVKAVLFDLDGTLIDSEVKIRKDLSDAHIELGEILPAGINIFTDDAWGDFLVQKKRERAIKEQKRDLTKDEIKKVISDFYAVYDRVSKRNTWARAAELGLISTFPDTFSVLDSLKNRGYKLLVVSRSDIESTLEKLNALGLSKYFPSAYIVPAEKKRATLSITKTRGYMQAIDREGLAAEFIAVGIASGPASYLFTVGDSLEDVFAGTALKRWTARKQEYKNTRVVTILVNRKKYTKIRFADFVVNNLTEALGIMESFKE